MYFNLINHWENQIHDLELIQHEHSFTTDGEKLVNNLIISRNLLFFLLSGDNMID